MKKTYEKPIFQKTQYVSMDSIATEPEAFDSGIGIVPLSPQFPGIQRDEWGEYGGAECGCKSISG